MKNYEINLSIKAISVLREIFDSPGIDIVKLGDVYGIQSKHYVKQLLDYELIEDKRDQLKENDKGNYLGCYVISTAGIAYLENYRLIERRNKKEFLAKSIIIPMVVTILTNTLVFLITKLLIPTLISLLAQGGS